MTEPVRRGRRPIRLLAGLLAGALILGSSACGGESEGEVAAAPGVPSAGSATPSAESSSAAVSAGGPLVMTPVLKSAGVTEDDLRGPHRPAADAFHPDGSAEPALGGRVIMHVSAEPANVNFLLDNSSTVRWLYFEVHAGLLQFDPSTWEYEHDLARAHWSEDSVFLTDGTRVFGKIVRDDEDGVVLESGAPQNGMARTEIARADIERVARGTVWTFELRPDVRWHDGHAFDADDVVYTMALFDNPAVDCDSKRFKYEDMSAEKLDDRTVRFFRDEQYFGTKASFGLDYVILPRHLYDLTDPDNPEHDPAADAATQAAYVNDNPHNKQFVGLGPYRITEWQTGQFIEAERFDDYWESDPAEVGYLDELRWRFVKNDDSAWQALLNEEIDLFYRVKTEDFVGAATRSEVFTRNFYKALTYAGNLQYTSWNLYRDKFDDVRVRQALAHAFDVPSWLATNYSGLALWSTASQFWFGPGYNHAVEPLAYDPETAEDLLAEAGWYDRDGNGIVDRDGEDLVIAALTPSGNRASERLLQAMQAAFGEVGVKLDIVAMEWATMIDKLHSRDFDAVTMAWTLPDPESDPMQLWHSSNGAFERRSSNRPGLRDAEVDRLIEAGRRELDPDRRRAIWHELHQRIYDLQPYLFGWTVPRKVAVNRKLHGLRLYKFEPGFRLRDLYYAAGTPGTRPLDG